MRRTELTMAMLEEAISNTVNMDLSEIRLLYYGRLDVFSTFSNDQHLETDGYESSNLKRPSGVVAHSIDSIVGRKARTSRLYAHIFRYRTSTEGFVANIRNLTSEDYKEVKEALAVLPYIKKDILEDSIGAVERNGRLRSAFQRIWRLTFLIASTMGSSQSGDMLWSKILLDLGFKGFNDQEGTGLFAKKGEPAILILNDEKVEIIDIMPIQKTRRDSRERIRYWVDQRNKRTVHKRNRIAKRKTEPFRTDKKKENDIVKAIKDMVKLRYD